MRILKPYAALSFICVVSGCADAKNTLNIDNDGDGYSEFEGDCNDADPNQGPGTKNVYCEPHGILSAGSNTTCAVSNAHVTCWGRDYFLEEHNRGLNETPNDRFQSVSVGGVTCGITAAETIKCWGDRFIETIDLGLSEAPSGRFQSVATGGFLHNCALTHDGLVSCWAGDLAVIDALGLLYPNTDEYDYDSLVGQLLAPPPGPFKSISAGYTHTCGISTGDQVECWGISDGSEYDDGQVTATPSGSFQSVSAGNVHNCGIRNDGTVECWGGNLYGQANPPTGKFQSVSAGGLHSCGIRLSGTVECWGLAFSRRHTPTGKYTFVSAGSNHNCALSENEQIHCWGNNNDGQSDPPEDL